MRYGTRFTDEQIVAALRKLGAGGVRRDDAPDRLQPPNLCAFFNNLPVPERQRLLSAAFPAKVGGKS